MSPLWRADGTGRGRSINISSLCCDNSPSMGDKERNDCTEAQRQRQREDKIRKENTVLRENL